jgi:hypothetical protein
MAVHVKAWVITSYYKTSITTIPNPFGGTDSEASTVTIPVFPTAAVSTITATTVTDNAGIGGPYLTVVEVIVPSDAPATTTTTAPFACDSNGVNTCNSPESTPPYTEYIAYLTITAPSYCSVTFSYVATTALDKNFEVPPEVTSEVLASATYKTTYVSEDSDAGAVTYVDVYVPPDMFTATVGGEISSYVSNCVDPRAVTDVNVFLGQSTMTCTPGPDGPTQGCPVPTPSAAASSTTPPLIDTSAIFSAISSAEASATGGGKKNGAASHAGGGGYWALLAGVLLVPFFAGAFLL